MSIPGFAAAQARYDAMLPADPYYPDFECKYSGDVVEDCMAQEIHDGDCEPDEGCDDCHAPLARQCRCDDMYEAAKERRLFGDDD